MPSLDITAHGSLRSTVSFPNAQTQSQSLFLTNRNSADTDPGMAEQAHSSQAPGFRFLQPLEEWSVWVQKSMLDLTVIVLSTSFILISFSLLHSLQT